MNSRDLEKNPGARTETIDMNKSNYFLALIFLSLLLITLASTYVDAQENQRTMELSLHKAIQLALEKNFDVQLRSLDTQSAYADYLGSTGVYDYYIQENANFENATQRPYSSFSASQSDAQRLTSTFGRRFFTGGDAAIVLSNSRRASNSITSTLNPQYTNTMTLEVTQPILRNFGRMATEYQVIVSRNNMKVSESDLESQIITTLVDVQQRYWALVSAYEQYKVAKDNLDLAKEQLEINKVKVRVGTLPEIDIIQAEQNVAASESLLLDAELLIQQAEDNLKTGIVMDDWEISLVPTDELIYPDDKEYEFAEAFNKAIKNRPEVKRLDIQLENNEAGIKYAKNQLRPTLDLQASVDLTGAGGTFVPSFFGESPPDGLPIGFSESFTDTFSGENYSWAVGAVFRYVFGNHAAEAQLLNNQVSKKQNMLRREQLRYTIAVDVRSAIRELNGAAKQLEARMKTLEFAERQYEAEKQKFDVGTSTNFEVLSFQNNMIQARQNVISAQIRFNNALVDYERATGEALSKHQVQIETSETGATGAIIK